MLSLAEGGGSRPDDGTRKRMGAYLMFCGMATLSPLFRSLADGDGGQSPRGRDREDAGFQVSFGSWLVASVVPTLVCLAFLPFLIYKVFPPEVKATPEAPAAARKALAAMGPLTRDEKIVAATFVVMVLLWAFAGTLKIDLTAVAFLGLGVLMATAVLTLQDIAKQGDVLATFIWFSILFALSAQLNALGFMGYLGQRLGAALGGLSWPVVYVLLVLAYVVLHYLFVSQTAHVLALFGVFLGVGAQLGVPGPAPRLRAPLFDELLLHDHAAGFERERSRRRQRLPDAGRALPARHDHDGVQYPCPPSRGNAMASVRDALMETPA